MNDSAEPTRVAKTIADQTYQQLRRDVLSGALPPGSKLAMELLTKRYNVGLSPLREALVKLTGDALAVAEGQRGFWVSQISPEELQDTMSTRVLIETQALSLAIEKGGPEWERAVKQTFQELCALEDRIERGDAAAMARWQGANRRFHEALISACGSKWLIRLRGMLHCHCDRYRMISMQEPHVEREEQQAIVEAALARKTQRACRLMELHLQRIAEAIKTALENRDPASMSKSKGRGNGARGANQRS